MAAKQLSTSLKPSGGNLFLSVRNALAGGSLDAVAGQESYNDFTDALGSIAGNESLQLTTSLKGTTRGQFDAVRASMARKDSGVIPSDMLEQFNGAVTALKSVAGNEGFSLNNFHGSEADIKAVNVALNIRSHLQTPAAEAMFPSISVRYEDEGIDLKVRAAGLGTYAYGNSAWQSASELRPIFGILRTGDMFRDEALALYPVFPADATAEDRLFFMDESIHASWDANYMEGDAYGRVSHATQYLKVPSSIPNLLGLCQVPGQRPWTQTDEIESNSLTCTSLAVGGTLDSKPVHFFINTTGMTGVALSPTTQGQSTDDRQLTMHIRNLPGFSIQDKDGNQVGDTMFAAFKAAGYEPMLNVSLNANYNRQTNELRLSAGDVTVNALLDTTSKVLVTVGKATAPQKALMRSLSSTAINGVLFTGNVSNTSRGNFGYRIEVFNAIKHLSTKRNSPVSVKYPISKEDVNQESLDYAIEQMGIAINNQASAKAFDEAAKHRAYITSIDGAPVVGNQQGQNVLPGQHFVSATAVNASMSLRESVSSPDTQAVFDNVTTAILNQLSDMTAAMNTKSGLAAIAEYGGIDKIEWTIIVHQNLARFIMRSGDARTVGFNMPLNVVETNFDRQIGQIIVIPKANSTNESINPIGGIGVCVTKENIVVQGNVTREQQDFGVLMTLPTYRHWALNPMIGVLEITDAAEFLGENGLLTQLAKQAITVTGLQAGLVAIADASAPVVPKP